MVKFVIREKSAPNRILIKNSRGINEATYTDKAKAKRHAKNFSKNKIVGIGKVFVKEIK